MGPREAAQPIAYASRAIAASPSCSGRSSRSSPWTTDRWVTPISVGVSRPTGSAAPGSTVGEGHVGGVAVPARRLDAVLGERVHSGSTQLLHLRRVDERDDHILVAAGEAGMAGDLRGEGEPPRGNLRRGLQPPLVDLVDVTGVRDGDVQITRLQPAWDRERVREGPVRVEGEHGAVAEVRLVGGHSHRHSPSPDLEVYRGLPGGADHRPRHERRDGRNVSVSKFGLVAIHYPRAGEQTFVVALVRDAAEAMRATPGCLSAEYWVNPADGTVVTTGQWESEQSVRAAFSAVLAAGVPIDDTTTADEVFAKVRLVQTNIKRLVDNHAK